MKGVIARATVAGLVMFGQAPADDGASQAELARRLGMLELRGARATEETLALLDDFERMIEDPVLRAETRRFRGDCFRKGGRLDDAIAAYVSVAADAAARLYQRLDALRAIGESHWAKGRYEEAADHFRNLQAEISRVSDPNPEPQLRALLGWLDVAAAHHVAAVLGSLGRGDEALQAYDHAIALNTPPREEAVKRGFTNARAMVNQATIAETMGLPDRSARLLRAARQDEPAFFAPYIDFKLLQFANLTPGSVERTRALEGILERHPEDPWCVVIRVTLYHELVAAEELATARPHLVRAVEGPPVDTAAYGGIAASFEAEAWLAYINRMMSEKDYREAERAVGVFLERHPDDPRAKVVKDEYMVDLANLRAAGEIEGLAPRAVRLDALPPVSASPAPPWRQSRLLPYLISNSLAVALLAGWSYMRRRLHRGGEGSA